MENNEKKEALATITFVGQDTLYMRYKGINGMSCSKEDLHLLAQHVLTDFFKIDGLYPVVSTLEYTCIPKFTHPHETWIRQHHLNLPYETKVVEIDENLSIEDGDASRTLMLELAYDVFAYAATDDSTVNKGDYVIFVPTYYDPQDKTIHGTID